MMKKLLLSDVAVVLSGVFLGFLVATVILSAAIFAAFFVS
jgi:hypothetical protein